MDDISILKEKMENGEFERCCTNMDVIFKCVESIPIDQMAEFYASSLAFCQVSLEFHDTVINDPKMIIAFIYSLRTYFKEHQEILEKINAFPDIKMEFI